MKEIEISRAIIEQFTAKLLDRLENDVVIAGSGPAGLAAAYYLAKNGVKTTVIERKLAIGGGIWGGAAGFNEIVLEDSQILDEIGIPSKKKGSLTIADSVEFATTLCSKTIAAGAVIFNLTDIEDIIVKKNAVCGKVLWRIPRNRQLSGKTKSAALSSTAQESNLPNFTLTRSA